MYLLIRLTQDKDFLGGVSATQSTKEHNDVVQLLTTNLAKLEGGNWEIVEVEKTATQVVGGMKYYIYGTFKDKKEKSNYKATVTIYSRPWEDFIQRKSNETRLSYLVTKIIIIFYCSGYSG